MKPQILAVKPALAGPQATALTSRLAKVQENRLWAYGGTFCLSVPLESSLECGFFPDPVLAFFSREREGATFTEQDGMLVMKHDRLEQRTAILPSQQIPVLQAVGQKVAILTQLNHLSVVASLCRNNTADFTQGAWFNGGMIFAMHQRSLCFSTDGLPEGCPNFGLPSDTMLALSRIESPLTHFLWDQQCVQFEFEDGTWLASRTLGGLEIPNFMQAFENDEPATLIEFDPEIVEEILSYKLSGEENGLVLDMIWHGKDGHLMFSAPDRTTGVFEDGYRGGEEFKIKGEALRMVLALEPDELVLKGQRTLNGFGADFAVAACLSRI